MLYLPLRRVGAATRSVCPARRVGAAIRDFSGNAAGEFPARRPGCVPCKAAFGVAIGPCAAYEAAFGVVTWRNTACEATFSAVTCSLPCEAIPGIPARAAHPARRAGAATRSVCPARRVGAAIRDFSGNAAGEFPARRPGCVPCKAAFGVAIGPCAAYEAAFGVVTWRNTACEATFSAVTCSLPCEAIPGIPARAAHPREASRRGDALCVPREVTLSAAARLGGPTCRQRGLNGRLAARHHPAERPAPPQCFRLFSAHIVPPEGKPYTKEPAV